MSFTIAFIVDRISNFGPKVSSKWSLSRDFSGQLTDLNCIQSANVLIVPTVWLYFAVENENNQFLKVVQRRQDLVVICGKLTNYRKDQGRFLSTKPDLWSQRELLPIRPNELLLKVSTVLSTKMCTYKSI